MKLKSYCVFLIVILPMFLLPFAADGAGSVTINGGAAYTNNTSVALSISYPKGTYLLGVQEPNGPAMSVSPANNLPFNVGSGDGIKTIQVTAYFTNQTSYCCNTDIWGNCASTCFKNISGTESYQSSITLDTTRPSGTLQIDGGAQYTNSTTVQLRLDVSDDNVVTAVKFGNCTGAWGAEQTVSEQSATVTEPWHVSSGDGPKTVYAQAVDGAGNWSDIISSGISLDTTPPESSISSPVSGSFVAPKPLVVSGAASDGGGSGVQKIEISYDGGKTWAEPADIMQSGGWAAWWYVFSPTALGNWSIRSRATDLAGNVESPGAGINFTVDGTEPASSINAFSWEKINQASARFIAFSPDYGNDHTAFAGTSGSGVLKTQDGGSTWAAVNSGLVDLNILSIAVSPAFSSYSAVFAGTASGIFKSVDGGRTWAASGSGLPQGSVSDIAFSPDYASDGTVFAVTGNGAAYKTTGGGAGWNSTGALPGAAVAIAVSPAYAADNIVFAGTAPGPSVTGGGVFRSTDGGSTWNQVNPQIGSVCSIAISPDFATDRTVFVSGSASDGSGPCLYKSTDGGSTWNRITTGAEGGITGIAISPDFASDNTLYIATGGGGVFKSDDGGNTWTISGPGLPGSGVVYAAISPAYGQDNTLFAALPEGIFKSRADTILVNGTVCAIDGTASDGGGSGVMKVEISTDGGNTWQPATDTSGGIWKTWSYKWPVPQDGAYSIKSRATSNVGNAETPGAGITAIVDNTPPVSQISSPLSGSEMSGATMTVTGSATDGAGTGVDMIQVSTDGNTWTDANDTSSDGSWSNWSCAIAAPANGAYTVQSRGIDYLGNVEVPKSGISIQVNNAMPSSGIDSPANGSYVSGSELTVTGTALDNSGLGISQVQVFSSATGNWTPASDTSSDGSWSSWSCSVAMPADGEYTLQSRAIDKSGNIENPGAGVAITVDNTKPVGTISINGNASTTNNASVTLSLSASDKNAITGMQISNDGSFNGSSWEAFNPSENWTLPAGDGEKTVYARFADPAGNITTCSAGILLDTTSPVVSITDLQPSQVLSGQSFNITGSAYDGGSGVNRVEITFGNGVWTEVSGSSNWNYLWSLPLSGNFTIGVRATDNAGNVSAVYTLPVSINNISPTAAEPLNNAVRPAAYVLPPGFTNPPIFTWIPNVCEDFIVYFSSAPDFKRSLRFTSDNHGITPEFHPAPKIWNRITRLGWTIFWKVSGHDAQNERFYSETQKLLLDGNFTNVSAVPSTDVFTIPEMTADPGESSSLSVQFSSEPYFIAPINLPAHEYGSLSTYTPTTYAWQKITRLGPEFYWRFSGKLPTGETTFSAANLTCITGGPEIVYPAADSIITSPPEISWNPAGFAACTVQASASEDFTTRTITVGVSKNGNFIPGGKIWKKIITLGATVFLRIAGRTALKYTAYGPPLKLLIR